ncbi:MAG: PorT family protein, partial [Bacteroidales bacterium]|nr:PorT family protein [Bacteroidales bacterium]
PDSSVIIPNAENFQEAVAVQNDSLDTNDKISIPIQVAEATEIPDTQAYVNQTFEAPQMISPPSKPKKQKVKIGVELASFTNYSPENITPTMNYGGGIVADIPIRKRFSFNPGLVFSAYNMVLEDNQSLITQTEYADITTLGVNVVTESNSTVKPSEVHLTGLDIPINFQYQFLQRKKGDYFVEFGFSSLIYLSENYSYDLSYIDNSGCPPGQTCSHIATVTEELSTPAFKTFDFAKLVNFSVGMDYHLSKRLDMVVNPYLKYPVNSLSSADLKFGSGGLKLKFMLIPKK